MKIYMYGKVVHINKNYIIIEHNGTGELIYVSDINKYKNDENIKVFIHEYDNEYFKTTYGFSSFKELIVFEDLISIQGIGPKTALSVLSTGWQSIVKYVAEADIDKLTKIPYLSTRCARQLIFEFQPKYEKFVQKMKIQTTNESDSNEYSVADNAKSELNENLKNLEKSLKILGFKQKQINLAVNKIGDFSDLEKAVEQAIKLIADAGKDATI
ncbi:Holliday junction branch migration protein RuvA [Mycoplasma phocoenae]|uniref:Holliday junction branch migration complex subunit RuvA n=1 Tax=Mycoplasma phocoenae TaxID=754517 RepID=A0A858U3L5_9MOLU|nr:Holliday junction branch migration protein RuvA [Mycoplasma phocoenae]QJG67012.1 Holliday junction branch migration protein RuvA [Mycoplasma phocoenae]